MTGRHSTKCLGSSWLNSQQLCLLAGEESETVAWQLAREGAERQGCLVAKRRDATGASPVFESW